TSCCSYTLSLHDALPICREGIFALWLTSRVALDLATLPIDRGQRRRVALLTRRLAPLAVPRPLARGLATALDHLGDGSAGGARRSEEHTSELQSRENIVC